MSDTKAAIEDIVRQRDEAQRIAAALLLEHGRKATIEQTEWDAAEHLSVRISYIEGPYSGNSKRRVVLSGKLPAVDAESLSIRVAALEGRGEGEPHRTTAHWRDKAVAAEQARDAHAAALGQTESLLADRDATIREKDAEIQRLRADYDGAFARYRDIARAAVTALEAPCAHCDNSATCFGEYEGIPGYACDECCGHGCEDGHCDPLPKSRKDARIAELEKQLAEARGEREETEAALADEQSSGSESGATIHRQSRMIESLQARVKELEGEVAASGETVRYACCKWGEANGEIARVTADRDRLQQLLRQCAVYSAEATGDEHIDGLAAEESMDSAIEDIPQLVSNRTADLECRLTQAEHERDRLQAENAKLREAWEPIRCDSCQKWATCTGPSGRMCDDCCSHAGYGEEQCSPIPPLPSEAQPEKGDADFKASRAAFVEKTPITFDAENAKLRSPWHPVSEPAVGDENGDVVWLDLPHWEIWIGMSGKKTHHTATHWASCDILPPLPSEAQPEKGEEQVIDEKLSCAPITFNAETAKIPGLVWPCRKPGLTAEFARDNDSPFIDDYPIWMKLSDGTEKLYTEKGRYQNDHVESSYDIIGPASPAPVQEPAVSDKDTCPRCEGTGTYQRLPSSPQKACSICGGTGRFVADTPEPAPPVPAAEEIRTTVRCFKGSDGMYVWAMWTEEDGIAIGIDNDRIHPSVVLMSELAASDKEITPAAALAELANWPEGQAELRRLFEAHPKGGET